MKTVPGSVPTAGAPSPARQGLRHSQRWALHTCRGQVPGGSGGQRFNDLGSLTSAPGAVVGKHTYGGREYKIMKLGEGSGANANLRMVPIEGDAEAGGRDSPIRAESPRKRGCEAQAEKGVVIPSIMEEMEGIDSGSLVTTTGAPLTSSRGAGSPVVSEERPVIMVPKPLPKVLLIHTGGTLGMDPESSFEKDDTGHVHVKAGTGGKYVAGLQPGRMLSNIKQVVPELSVFADVDLKVAFNRDSCRVGPKEWVKLAQLLHNNRDYYDAFVLVHGTDTMAYTASALSLMLLGFRKPIVLTGSQLPLAMPRSDARANLIDSITCATAPYTPPHSQWAEVAVCFGGRLLRGNRAQKVNSSVYQAFDTPSYPHLAEMGIEIDWKQEFLLKERGVYRPRFKLNPNVIRVPIVPGSDPRIMYGDLAERGVRGIILESFGVGNMPDTASAGWLPWLRQQRKKGLQVYLGSQCLNGMLNPELYRSGSVAIGMGVESGPQMTAECAVVKMMLCLEYPDIPLGVPLAGEL